MAATQVLLAKGDAAGAAALADEALAVVESVGSMGLIEMSLRLHAARAHQAAGRRADAARGVTVALERLATRAARIDDPTLRARFLTDVPEHAALRTLAQELGVG